MQVINTSPHIICSTVLSFDIRLPFYQYTLLTHCFTLEVKNSPGVCNVFCFGHFRAFMFNLECGLWDAVGCDADTSFPGRRVRPLQQL